MNKTVDFCLSYFWGFQRAGAASELGEQVLIKEACSAALIVWKSAALLFVLAALCYVTSWEQY